MKTIHQIEIDKTFYKREKDVFGNVHREPYTKRIKRPVNLVDSGTRFGYFMIDLVIMLAIQAGIVLLLLFLGVSLESEIGDFLRFLSWFGYYFLFELFMQQTPGKMILGYVVIDQSAQNPKAGAVLLRSICRMIPFEAFSCFSERGGWHDRFSETWVVKKEERTTLQTLLGELVPTNNDLLDR